MYISLKDSCANGFRKWADAHQPEIKNDLRASGGNRLVAANPDDVTQAAASSMARAGRGHAINHIPPSPLDDLVSPRQKGDRNEHRAYARATPVSGIRGLS